jgi:hypothetical protein
MKGQKLLKFIVNYEGERKISSEVEVDLSSCPNRVGTLFPVEWLTSKKDRKDNIVAQLNGTIPLAEQIYVL